MALRWLPQLIGSCARPLSVDGKVVYLLRMAVLLKNRKIMVAIEWPFENMFSFHVSLQ